MSRDEVIGFVITPAWERLPARNEMEEKSGRFKDKEGHWELKAYTDITWHSYVNLKSEDVHFESRGFSYVGKLEGSREEIEKIGFPVRPREDDEIFKVGWPSG